MPRTKKQHPPQPRTVEEICAALRGNPHQYTVRLFEMQNSKGK